MDDTPWHKPADIKGYKPLTPEQIELMNMIKAEGPRLEALIDALLRGEDLDDADTDVDVDWRWIEIGRTHLQQGLMALTRAVAKPDFF